ncbi:cellulose binding domain-containing protein [Micromonospora sp. NPDC049359]|uniref:cellulose binding domain-containing protein n=1 Tax=Micromonospora sp. NPDC049359 TaxID=3364270 RepID=UPI0037A5F569
MRRILLALTTIALTTATTGWAATTGVAQAAPTPTASVTAAPTPTPVCPPALPIGGRVSAATTTSLTVVYFIALSPPCGYRPPITVGLFASREDAYAWRNPVAELVSAERDGTVTFDRLTPDTEYWFGFRDSESRWEPYYGGSGRTAALTSCRATATIDSRWGTGFVATVTVRNVGPQPLDQWRVSWRWAGDERIQAVWGGVVDPAGADVVVRNAPYNGTLAPDGVTTFGLLATASAPPAGLTLTCAR